MGVASFGQRYTQTNLVSAVQERRRPQIPSWSIPGAFREVPAARGGYRIRRRGYSTLYNGAGV